MKRGDSSHLVAQPATPDYVLEVIRDSYRQQLQLDQEAEPGIELGFNSTVSEWRAACDLLPWKPLGRALSLQWQFDATSSEWKAVLEPSCKMKLVDVCGFIAARAVRHEILPSRLLGTLCYSGGAFLAVRKMLMESGANVNALRPSASIAPYLNRYPNTFLDPVSRLAPNRLPLIKVRAPVQAGLRMLFLAGLIATSAFGCFDQFLMASVSMIIAALSAVSLHIAPTAQYEFPGIVTFRDLVGHLLGEDVPSKIPGLGCDPCGASRISG